MDKTNIAEWLLARVTPGERAAGIVGDLLEEHSRSSHWASPIFFWCRLANVFFALGWRTVCAPLGAFFSILIPAFMFARVAGPHTHGQSEHLTWVTWAVPLLGISGCLWSVVILSAVLYGLRDMTTPVALILSLVTTLGGSFAWQPFTSYLVAGVGILACIVVLAVQRLRSPFLCVLGASGGAALLYCLVETLMVQVSRFTQSPKSLLLMSWIGPPAWLLCIAGEMWLLRRGRVLLPTA